MKEAYLLVTYFFTLEHRKYAIREGKETLFLHDHFDYLQKLLIYEIEACLQKNGTQTEIFYDFISIFESVSLETYVLILL